MSDLTLRSATADIFVGAAEKAVADFAILSASSYLTPAQLEEFKSTAGVYAFFDNDIPVYVGRTKALGRRVRGHGSNSMFSATLAVRMTRKSLSKPATFRKGEGLKSLMLEPEFRAEFERHCETVKSFKIKLLPVADGIEQYLLEYFATLAWGLNLDAFNNH